MQIKLGRSIKIMNKETLQEIKKMYEIIDSTKDPIEKRVEVEALLGFISGYITAKLEK